MAREERKQACVGGAQVGKLAEDACDEWPFHADEQGSSPAARYRFADGA